MKCCVKGQNVSIHIFDFFQGKIVPPQKSTFWAARCEVCEVRKVCEVCCEVRSARGLGGLLRDERCARSARWEVRDLQGLWKANSITAQYSQ